MNKVMIGALFALIAATPAAAQQVVLKFNSPSPPRSYLHPNVFDPWVEAIEKDSAAL